MDSDLVNLKKDFLKAEALLSVIDPKETPFQSKYQARKILQDVVSKTDDAAILGGLHCLLGIIDVDVEEFSQSETDLLQALSYICEVDNRDKIIIQEVKTLNQLGILWCLRDDYEKAKMYLDRSLQSYLQFLKNEDKKCLYELADLFESSVHPSFEEKEKSLELLNTHTYYYLAQVYEKMGDASKAAECCHITLTKQLELKEFQHLDWATNAAMLSQHYLAKEDYSTTKRHLIASWVMLDRYQSELNSKEVENEIKDDRQEMLIKCRAEVSRAWGKYCLLLLQRSMDHDVEQSQLENQLIDVPDQEEPKKIDFPSIETDPELDQDIPEKFAGNFEEARAIFLAGQKFLNKAKNEYFKFEEHCVDYVEIQRDLSHMHKILVYFEKDESRQFKIQKRRIDLLETPAKELNPQLFTLLVRQLWYEMAETYSAMMDIKLDLVKNGTSLTPQLTNKINGLVSASINSFNKYLDTLGKNPTKYPEDNERPALVAYVHLARLYDKYILADQEQKFRNKMQTYICYKHVVDYCKSNPVSGPASVEQELPICEEMVLLLPRKLQKMQQELN